MRCFSALLFSSVSKVYLGVINMTMSWQLLSKKLYNNYKPRFDIVFNNLETEKYCILVIKGFGK